MTLAIFDLDHTLIDCDSDYLWGEYMVDNGIVDEASYREKNRLFYEDYQRGKLDNDRYLAFALEPLTHYSIEELHRWRQDFVEQCIKPRVLPGAAPLLERHRRQGHELILLSATNFFITEPIALALKVPTVLSTKPEIVDDRYSGRFLGVPTYREGKVTALNEWLENTRHDLEGSFFYSDSMNDLPLLELVDQPIVVHPDAELKVIAEQRGWKIIDLH